MFYIFSSHYQARQIHTALHMLSKFQVTIDCFVDMYGVAGKRRTGDLYVTGLRPPLVIRHNTLCAVGQ